MRRRSGFALGAALVCCVAAGPAQAADEDSSWIRYLGVLGTYGMPDDMRSPGMKDATGVQLMYGAQRDDRWGFEVQAFGRILETGDFYGTDFYHWGLGLDITRAFGDRAHDTLTPYVLAGAGYGYNDVAGVAGDDSDWFLNAGVGAVTKPILWELFRIRGALRAIYDHYGESVSGDAYLDYQVAVGIEFLLSDLAPPPAPVETVRVVKVPTGLVDEDGDGIVDSHDECPATEAGKRVDSKGCDLPKIMRLDGVTFEFDRARLRPDAKTILNNIAEILLRYPDMLVEIAGHTDSLGSDAYNQKLSEQRAASVRDHLVTIGVPGKRMSVKGYGESEPVATNETDDGREYNRRVEMRILN